MPAPPRPRYRSGYSVLRSLPPDTQRKWQPLVQACDTCLAARGLPTEMIGLVLWFVISRSPPYGLPPFLTLRRCLRSFTGVYVFGSVVLRHIYRGPWVPNGVDLCVPQGGAFDDVVTALCRAFGAVSKRCRTHTTVVLQDGQIVNVYRPEYPLSTFIRSLELREAGIVFNLHRGLWEVPGDLLVPGPRPVTWPDAAYNSRSERWEIPDHWLTSGPLPSFWTLRPMPVDTLLRAHKLSVYDDDVDLSDVLVDGRPEPLDRYSRPAALSGVRLYTVRLVSDADDVLECRAKYWDDGVS